MQGSHPVLVATASGPVVAVIVVGGPAWSSLPTATTVNWKVVLGFSHNPKAARCCPSAGATENMRAEPWGLP
jgi:hypothetical protein